MCYLKFQNPCQELTVRRQCHRHDFCLLFFGPGRSPAHAEGPLSLPWDSKTARLLTHPILWGNAEQGKECKHVEESAKEPVARREMWRTAPHPAGLQPKEGLELWWQRSVGERRRPKRWNRRGRHQQRWGAWSREEEWDAGVREEGVEEWGGYVYRHICTGASHGPRCERGVALHCNKPRTPCRVRNEQRCVRRSQMSRRSWPKGASELVIPSWAEMILSSQVMDLEGMSWDLGQRCMCA